MKSCCLCIFLIINLIVIKNEKAYAQCSEQDIVNLKKIAIVFGEKSYKSYGLLANPTNDANDICDSLRNVGFTVFCYLDVNKREMEEDVNKWYDKLSGYDVALFYFSGHGAEVNGQNYLFPIDASPKSPSDLNYQAFSANQMLDHIESYTNLKYSIVILDACRSNPFTKGWSRDVSDKGLASMAAKGAFIAFAASPGKVALDGNNRNGTYTEGILKYITTPNLTIDEIFTRVNAYVKKSTNGDQAPYKNSSLGSDYCFSVNRTYIAASKSKFSVFQQPNSKIFLSQDQEHLYAIANNNEGIFVRDAKTLNIISSVKTGSGYQNIVASKTGDIIYLTDSTRHLITIVDWRKKEIVDSIKIDYPALSLMFSADGKKMYVCGNLSTGGVVSIIDIQSHSSIKSISLGFKVSKMVISPDYKHLYVLSKSSAQTLLTIDIKSEKIIKQNNHLDIGDAIGITPDNKKLYIGSYDHNTISVLDPVNYITQKTIRVPALSFAFTDDTKYMFALSNNKITMIECATDEPMYEYPFTSPPKGIVATTDGHAFVWLPNEQQYMFTLTLLDSTRMLNGGSDLELKLKEFREKLKDDKSLEETRKSYDEIQKKIKSHQDSCERFTPYAEMLQRILMPVINKVADDINNVNLKPFHESGINMNCDSRAAEFQYGIHNVLKPADMINPYFRLYFSVESVVLKIIDSESNTAPETFQLIKGSDKKNSTDGSIQFVLDSDVEIALKKFVREYFLKRLPNLLK